ncbi:MAG: alpha/beta hydrolase [Saprospiraceae bacterium]
MKNKLKYLLILLSLLLLIAFLGLHFIAPYAILQPPKILTQRSPAALNLATKSFNIVTQDQLKLDGHWIASALDTTHSILILVHGIGGCKDHFLALAQVLSEQGIETIIFDGRAHGKSEGKYCTYGFKEKQDIVQIVDEIKKRQADTPLGIWGNSLGGAIALQALALDPRIEFGIIESTFTSLPQIVFDYQQRIFKGLGLRLFSDYAIRRAGDIAGFDADGIQPIESVKQIQQPVLIAHGDTDKNIKVAYGKALFEALAAPQKEFALIENGGHFGLLATGGIAYQQQLMTFIKKHSK